jgi:predicted O-linked N-acetylglucosamine transferase (SPINDLY family)
VEVFCYSNAWTADDVTARLRSAADHWRSIAGVADEDVDRLVMSDRIDVLVDLSGHTAANRLTLFSRKPAPVQATWAGYSGTTGLQTVDYFIGDRFICHEGDERYFTERVIRLPDYFLAYMPNPCAPSISPAPVLSTGYVTFGCFNTLAKVNPCVVAVWSEILTQVPGARLHLKTDALLDSEVRDRYLALFGAHNISADRLILQPRSTSWNEYANTFAAIDIALDPFPFNGGTTSMDGLWMGVPLVTLQGKRCVGRFGSGILSTVGLIALVADTPEQYIKTSVTLASDPQRVAGLRATLRQRMADSPLCDTRALTRALEAAYRSMWRTWCDPQRAN